MLNVGCVSFGTEGWSLLESSDHLRAWENEHGDELAIMYAGDTRTPVDPQGIDELRVMWRSIAHESGGALVEADLVRLDGAIALRTILKFPQEPSGMTYVGGFTIPLLQGHYAIKVRCLELGVTGVREATVWMTSAHSPDESEEEPLKGWMQDPYDPEFRAPLLRNQADDEAHDSRFPDHPLSRIRAELRTIESTCRIEPAVRALQAIRR